MSQGRLALAFPHPAVQTARPPTPPPCSEVPPQAPPRLPTLLRTPFHANSTSTSTSTSTTSRLSFNCIASQVRATHGAHQGTWYFEVTVCSLGPTGACRLGWATRKGELQAPVGADPHSYSYRSKEGSKVCGGALVCGGAGGRMMGQIVEVAGEGSLIRGANKVWGPLHTTWRFGVEEQNTGVGWVGWGGVGQGGMGWGGWGAGIEGPQCAPRPPPALQVHNGLREEYGEEYGEGDIVGCILHLGEGGRPIEKNISGACCAALCCAVTWSSSRRASPTCRLSPHLPPPFHLSPLHLPPLPPCHPCRRGQVQEEPLLPAGRRSSGGPPAAAGVLCGLHAQRQAAGAGLRGGCPGSRAQGLGFGSPLWPSHAAAAGCRATPMRWVCMRCVCGGGAGVTCLVYELAGLTAGHPEGMRQRPG